MNEGPEWFCLLCGEQFYDDRDYDRHIFPPGQEFIAKAKGENQCRKLSQ